MRPNWQVYGDKIVINYKIIKSPIGDLFAIENCHKLCRLDFLEEKDISSHLKSIQKLFNDSIGESNSSILKESENQLRLYFNSKLEAFDLPLELEGTEFQKSVWNQLTKIPFGKTINYGQIAVRIDKPKSSRAVGMANHNNPIPIIIPCHRVIGKNGALVGYGGGLWRKKWLLEHEGAIAGHLL
jgi:AraC family transcriptional regulator of adaptative response/methylated-DNA-[protein]-cysteine methyltransferase